jgi:hypothetical protein
MEYLDQTERRWELQPGNDGVVLVHIGGAA